MTRTALFFSVAFALAITADARAEESSTRRPSNPMTDFAMVSLEGYYANGVVERLSGAFEREGGGGVALTASIRGDFGDGVGMVIEGSLDYGRLGSELGWLGASLGLGPIWYARDDLHVLATAQVGLAFLGGSETRDAQAQPLGIPLGLEAGVDWHVLRALVVGARVGHTWMPDVDRTRSYTHVGVVVGVTFGELE